MENFNTTNNSNNEILRVDRLFQENGILRVDLKRLQILMAIVDGDDKVSTLAKMVDCAPSKLTYALGAFALKGLVNITEEHIKLTTKGDRLMGALPAWTMDVAETVDSIGNMSVRSLALLRAVELKPHLKQAEHLKEMGISQVGGRTIFANLNSDKLLSKTRAYGNPGPGHVHHKLSDKGSQVLRSVLQ